MKKHVLFSIGILALTLLSAHAQQNPVLYTTYNDWTNANGSGAAWSSPNYTVQAVTTFDYDGVTVDGLGNATPGTTSPGGSLEISPIVSGWQPILSFGGQSAAFLQALDGNQATANTLVAQHGTLFVEYTQPDDNGGGSYFSLGLYLNYAGGWYQAWPSSVIDLGPTTTPSGPAEMEEAIIPYDITACTLNGYWNFGFFQSTDFTGEYPWYIDNVSAAYIPPVVYTNTVYQLFNTSDDFGLMTGDSGVTVSVDTTWSETNDIVIDGLGNTVSPGATSTNASLSVDWTAINTGWGPIVDLPNESGNTGFLQAVDPGYNPAVSTLAVPAYGFFYVDYTYPDNNDGSTSGAYWEIGVALSYSGGNEWSPFWWSTTTDLGYTDENGDELNRATCPYQIVGGGDLSQGFTPYIFVNSSSQWIPEFPFHIAGISVSASGAPVLTNIFVNGTSLVIQGTGGMADCSYSLFSTTNLATPYKSWTLVGSPGNAFAAPSFSITNPVPAVPTYYGLTVSQ